MPVIRCYRDTTLKEVLPSPHEHMNTEDLESLVMRIQRGDTHEYATIVQTFQQPIFRYCYRMLDNKQDAEDAVQDIFIKAYQSLHQYRKAEHFSAWLYRIAYHYCLNLLRKHRTRRRLLTLLSSGSPATSTDQALENVLYKPILAEALARLSIQERNLLFLRVYEEKSFAEIGDILKVSPNALAKRMQKIQRKMQKLMETKEEYKWNETQSSVNTRT